MKGMIFKMSKKKRNITIAAVLLCVCAAVYLNWSYNNNRLYDADAALSDMRTEETSAPAETPSAADVMVSDYFAQARLTRQQSRDEALQLLQAAATSQSASQETIDGAMSTIAAMASFSMVETQVENLLLAKNFAECVAFMSTDGVTIAVPAPEEGLSAEEVARITDTIIAETNYIASQIRIIEVKNAGTPASPPPPPSDSAPSWMDEYE